MPVIQVIRGRWLPPGSDKYVVKGGNYEVTEALAAHLTHQYPDQFKLVHKKEKPNGTDIQSSSGEPSDIQRESGSVGFDGLGRDVDQVERVLRTDDNP